MTAASPAPGEPRIYIEVQQGAVRSRKEISLEVWNLAVDAPDIAATLIDEALAEVRAVNERTKAR